ncbi:uncharacterized protein LOC112568471 [Pomacea canaliculata]|uniref:uncharacterized protein LOC112568471 n=1 Tax=Pomacea canaliculata TaxID=400727 RepID=UPI000D736A93|nr:uncharacterized protein LOC112568471 [Pomacea canaliculata]
MGVSEPRMGVKLCCRPSTCQWHHPSSSKQDCDSSIVVMKTAGMSHLGGLMLLVLAFTFTGENILTLDYSSGDFLEMESGDISMTEYASGDFLEMESGGFTMTECASGKTKFVINNRRLSFTHPHTTHHIP